MTIAGYMVDISDPGNNDYTGTSVIPGRHLHLPRCNAFYIGGNTPHVWTRAQIHRQSNEYRLPIWVYQNTSGKLDGEKAVTLVKELGMPRGCLICLDMETHVYPVYSREFHDVVTAAGYEYVVYESESVMGNFIGSNPRWGADWINQPFIATGDWATQYASASQLKHPFDISAVSSFDKLWNIKKEVVVPPPVILQAVIVHPSLITEKVISTDGKIWTTGKLQ